MRFCLFVFLVAALMPDMALAQTAVPSSSVLADRAARRFPQPVRVGDLLGRKVLEPNVRQPIVGVASGVVSTGDGATSLLIKLTGWLGFGERSVSVPIEAVALLGEHIVLVDLTPEQLGAFPTFDPAAAPELERDAAIRVGLVKPYH